MNSIRSLPLPLYRYTCVGCGVVFESKRFNKRFCTTRCRSKKQTRDFQEINPKLGLPTGTVGAISELRVAADLMSRGYEVFRALSPSCSCDLAIIDNNQLRRIEVRTGYITKTGKIGCAFNERDIGRHDVLAIVINRDSTVIYRPPPDEWT